jgi:small subunit ribosomal protein S6
MNSYELTLILRVSDGLEPLKEKVKEILQKHGVTVKSEDVWGSKKLAYEIDGEKDGFYTLQNIETLPDSVTKIISEFRLNSDILRYMFVRVSGEKSA